MIIVVLYSVRMKVEWIMAINLRFIHAARHRNAMYPLNLTLYFTLNSLTRDLKRVNHPAGPSV